MPNDHIQNILAEKVIQTNEEIVDIHIAVWKKHYKDKMSVCPDCFGFVVPVCEKALRKMLLAHLKKNNEILSSSLTSTYTAGYEAGTAYKGENERKAFQRGYDEGLTAAEGCVPERKSILADCAYQGADIPKKWLKENAPWYEGYNSCRNMTLEAINKLKT